MHTMDSPYCFPKSENEMVLRFRSAKDDLKKVSVVYESKYVIAGEQRTAELEKAYSTELFDFYEITLKLTDTRLAYVFLIEGDEGEFYYSEDGATKEYDFSMGYYNFFQYPYINGVDVVKPIEWMENAVFYQIFVERFNIGKKDKDMSYVNMEWNAKPNPKSFAGGDIKGITEKLDYIKNLGVNAIYLTPVFESRSNHKYDIIDYYKVDKDFGTNEDLKELVDEAHKRDIKIVLDAVFNHISIESKEFQDVVKNGKASKYYDWFIVHGDEVSVNPVNYETFASVKYMPKLNTNNPVVCDFLNGIGVHYINEYHIDGWRLDVSDEISYEYWRSFRKAIKNANSEAVIIGENWHDAYSNLRGDQYDSIMNYAFTKVCIDYFAKASKDAKAAAWKLNEILMRNKEGINRMMLNLLDSHDTERFFTQVSKRRSSLKSALTLLFFYMGAPCFFYGTEILTEGKSDPDCRRCMDWDKVSDHEYSDMYSLLRNLSEMRKAPEFVKSNIRISSENSVLIVKRNFEDTNYVLYINETDNDTNVENITVSARNFVIIRNGGILING